MSITLTKKELNHLWKHNDEGLYEYYLDEDDPDAVYNDAMEKINAALKINNSIKKDDEDSNEDSSASEAEESKEETKYEYQKLDVHIIEKKKKVNDDLFENKPTVKSLYSSSKHAKKVKNTKPENKPENKPEKK